MTHFKLLFFTILFSTYSFGHKFYVSITELNFNAEKNRIEGSLKLVAHDFEHILEEKFGREIDIEQVADTSQVGLYIQTYLTSHFKVYSDQKLLTPNYLGKEVSLRQELFFYFTFNSVPHPESLSIKSTVLFDYFPNQQNIVHYRYGQQTKSVTLVPSKNHGKIQFDE